MANEDEDKAIHKLEKLLKIDKSKSKKGIPKMFNDGLDYALEMCLPENIEKMYAAAKEAADADQQSDSEWQEDFALATGENGNHTEEASSTKGAKSKNQSKDSAKEMARAAADKKKADRLREIESKYFGASDDELASDLSDVDSEFERSVGEQGSESDENQFDDSDEAPEEINTVTKSSTKRKLDKSKAKIEPEYESDEESFDGSDSEDDMDDGLDGLADLDEESDELDEESDALDDESNEEPAEKKSKNSSKKEEGKNSPKKEKSKNLAKKEQAKYDDVFDFPNDYGIDQNVGWQSADENSDTWEDIYGRKRDKDGNIIKENAVEAESTGKYIPPHLRARLAAEAANGSSENGMDPKRKEKLMRLKRLLKGQLNRLSEANMHKITSEIDNLYMQNSRNDMNTTLSALICDALISHVLAPERMVMEHALLIAALHANVGTEVGANLLENLIDRFHQMLNDGIEQYDVEDKTLDNVIFILCHMYTFKVSAAKPHYLSCFSIFYNSNTILSF